MSDCKKPEIVFNKFSPYMVSGLPRLLDHECRELPVKKVMSLCRCGASKNKPYCDGTHTSIGFSGENDAANRAGKVRDYAGKEVVINDNRRVCCHDGHCLRELPAVFNKERKPWIDACAAGKEDIIRVVEGCPSGALSYTVDGVRHQDLDRPPLIQVDKDGPFKVTGGVLLKDEQETRPESAEHYTLCRCGASENKPFCDGMHFDIGFKG